MKGIQVSIFFGFILFASGQRFIIKDNNGLPTLAVDLLSTANKLYADECNNGDYELSIWETNVTLPEYIVGQRAQDDLGPMRGYIPHVQDITRNASNIALVEPESFLELWNNTGSSSCTRFSVWRLNCPNGFRALGDIATFCEPNEPCTLPAPDSYKSKLRCVRQDLLETCSFDDDDIWSTDGDSVATPASLWRTSGDLGIGGLYHMNEKSATEKPLNGVCYCLKRLDPEIV
ncbi:DgyrCDS8094 [Dimorphilus gyrociliatus]|uniref:DgyrCDS8094 n=1 Tax=Dimorphilus gyrociliatus TaxID=2664684 RepID=A0A7I8VUV4_9ANNE|nr:DgyrCDS8094 [Dimorphilus gyrociliatus]